MKCCIVCALYYFLLCVTKRISSFLPLSTVLPAAWSKNTSMLWNCSFVFSSLAMAQNSFPIRLCCGRKKRGTLLVSSKLLCEILYIYMCVYICIYIDPIIAMLFISAFSDLFSRKHNQVVKKTDQHPFKKQRKVFVSFFLPLNSYWNFYILSGSNLFSFFFFNTRSLETFYGWLKSNCDIMVYQRSTTNLWSQLLI